MGVREGKVARVGDLSGSEAIERIDVAGLVVAPAEEGLNEFRILTGVVFHFGEPLGSVN